jgi:hypothetical protein
MRKRLMFNLTNIDVRLTIILLQYYFILLERCLEENFRKSGRLEDII